MGRFVPNPAAPALLERSPLMLAYMAARAEEVAEKARALAPVDTGAYRDSIVAQAGIVDGKATGRAVATDPKAAYIEFGTGEPGPTPAFAPLRRGADAAGLHTGRRR